MLLDWEISWDWYHHLESVLKPEKIVFNFFNVLENVKSFTERFFLAVRMSLCKPQIRICFLNVNIVFERFQLLQRINISDMLYGA